MESSHFRLLLPSDDPGAPPRPPSSPPPKKKRPRTSLACNECRAKKAACDGRKPLPCTACQARSIQCIYRDKDVDKPPSAALVKEIDTLRGNVTALEHFFARLRTTPEQEAHEIMHKLRASTSADLYAVLKSINHNPVPSQPSECETARGVLPPMQSESEFELMVRHPHAYPTLHTWTESSVSREFLGTAPASIERAAPTEDSAPGQFTPQSSPIDTCQPVPSYFDSRLANLKEVGFWTGVAVTDAFAAGAISLYLQTDWPVFGLFEPSLFIHDFIERKFDHCSQFLVNSILAVASQGYASEDSQAYSLSYEFEKEALRLWRIERQGTDSIVLLTAIIHLTMSLTSHGRHEDRSHVADAAHSMAKRMKLFGVADPLRETPLLPEEVRRATAWTAWGSFNYVTLQALFYINEPTEYPPALSIPEPPIRGANSDDPSFNSAAQAHQAFTAYCQLCVILYEILYIYRGPSLAKPALSFALSRFHKLLSLADKLPETMLRNNTSAMSGYVPVFHMFYHVTILETFRPYIDPAKQQGFQSYLTEASSPEAIFAASVRQLKALTIQFTAQHPAATCSILWSAALIVLANAVLKDRLDPEWHFYFLYCVRMFQKLRSCYGIADSTVRGLVAVAVGDSAITNAEACMLIDGLKENEPTGLEEHITGSFVVDMDLALTDPVSAHVDVLVSRAQERRAFEEFTQGIL